jgi:hypothetical protein
MLRLVGCDVNVSDSYTLPNTVSGLTLLIMLSFPLVPHVLMFSPSCSSRRGQEAVIRAPPISQHLNDASFG